MKNKIFFDTEFHEHKVRGVDTIELISIGLVSENGDSLYMISKEFNLNAAWQNTWLRENVCKKLIKGTEIKSFKEFKGIIEKHGLNRLQMQKLILDFVSRDPIFFAYYASYDWVAFCWIFGRMMDLPEHFPMYPIDIQQVIHTFVDKEELKRNVPQVGLHNALDDAIWNRNAWNWIKTNVIEKYKLLKNDGQDL